MPYEDFSRDFSESFDDSGLVFTRNKYGRLYSPPGYHFEERSNKSYPDNKIIQGIGCDHLVRLGHDILRVFYYRS